MRNKYHNRKVIVDGLKFDSIKEAKRWRELCLLYRAGEIGEVKRQVEFVLIPAQRYRDDSGKIHTERAVKYVADYTYRDARSGKMIIEDVKGYKGGQAYAVFKIKKKLMRFIHGLEVREV